MHMNQTITHYRFGDTVFRIETPVPLMKDDRFEAFRVESCVAPAFTLTVESITDEMDTDKDWPAVLYRSDDRVRVCMNVGLLPYITVANLMVISRADRLMTERECFILHASYIIREGEAILFCAPCGTGKSTQARFWERERGSTVINEDRVLVFLRDGVFHAGGIWATGSAGVTRNVTAPIRAVILLSQGPENRVIEERPFQKLVRILPQCSYDDNDGRARERMTDLLIRLIGGVKVLSYACINHPSSVDDLEAYL